jgi:hypothetical protein
MVSYVRVFIVATAGLYGVYWLYKSSVELRAALQDDDEIHPLLETMLVVCSVGLYGIWLLLRNARKVHSTSLYFRRSHRNLSETIGWLTFFAPFTFGISLLVAAHMVQAQLNAFADLAAERERSRRAGSVSTPNLVRKVMLVPASISSRRLPAALDSDNGAASEPSDDPSGRVSGVVDREPSPVPRAASSTLTAVSPEESARTRLRVSG